MKGDRAAEDELNPSGNADLCWSGRRGRGGVGERRQVRQRRGGGVAGQGHCVCRRGCHGHPRPATGPALKPGDSCVRPTPSRPTMPPRGLATYITSCLDQVKGSPAWRWALGLGHAV